MMFWFFPALTFSVVAPVASTPEVEEVGLTHRQGAWVGDTLVVAYHAATNGVYQIFLRRYAGGVWEDAFRLTHTGADAKWLSLVRDAQDSLHIAWHDYRVDGIRNVEIFATTCTPNLACLPETRITWTSSGGPGDNSYVPVLFRGLGDTLHLVWYDYRDDPQSARARVYYTFRPPDGPWTAPQIPLSESGVNARFPFITGRGDTLFVVWSDNALGGYRIRTRRRTTTWEAIVTPVPYQGYAQDYAHAVWFAGDWAIAFEENGTVCLFHPDWGLFTVGTGQKPHLLAVWNRLWVVARTDSAVWGVALDSAGVRQDSFQLVRSGSLAHVYAGVWATLTPGGRLLLLWSESAGGGRDLMYALSAATAVAEPAHPVVQPRDVPGPLDLLGRKARGVRRGFLFHGQGRKEVVIR